MTNKNRKCKREIEKKWKYGKKEKNGSCWKRPWWLFNLINKVQWFSDSVVHSGCVFRCLGCILSLFLHLLTSLHKIHFNKNNSKFKSNHLSFTIYNKNRQIDLLHRVLGGLCCIASFVHHLAAFFLTAIRYLTSVADLENILTSS